MATRGDVWGVVSLLAVGFFVVWLKYGKRANPVAVGSSEPTLPVPEKFFARIDQIDKRLSRVEADIEHLPQREEMHEMNMAMAVLQERINGIEQTTAATGRAVGRIEDYMINSSRKPKE